MLHTLIVVQVHLVLSGGAVTLTTRRLEDTDDSMDLTSDKLPPVGSVGYQAPEKFRGI